MSKTPHDPSRSDLGTRPDIARVLAHLKGLFDHAGAQLKVTSAQVLDETRGHHLISVVGPGNESRRLFLQLAASGEPRQVDMTYGAYQRYRRKSPERQRPTGALLAAPNISALSRRRCDDQALDYLDVANNSYHISLTPYHLERIAPLSPGSRRRKLGPLFSPPRVQAIRVLLCAPHRRWHQKDLARRAYLSLGTANALVRRLESDGYVLREGKGPRQTFGLIRPGELLDAWAEESQTVQRSRRRYHARSPSPDALMEAMVRAGRRVASLPTPLPDGGPSSPPSALPHAPSPPLAFTGLSGAYLVAPHVIFELVETYTTLDPERLAREAGIHSVDDGANLVLLAPPDRTIFYQVTSRRGMPHVCLPQLYVDLTVAGGRARSEAAPELRSLILDPKLPLADDPYS